MNERQTREFFSNYKIAHYIIMAVVKKLRVGREWMLCDSPVSDLRADLFLAIAFLVHTHLDNELL